MRTCYGCKIYKIHPLTLPFSLLKGVEMVVSLNTQGFHLTTVTFLVSLLQKKCHPTSCSDQKWKGSGHYIMLNAKIKYMKLDRPPWTHFIIF